VDAYPTRDIYDAHNFISWADTERDLSAWLSNSMQHESLKQIYSVEETVLNCGDPEMLKIWERLQTSDHFYYMCTKFWNDGDVHKYFSPYDSPYDAYMFYMNVFSDLECKLNELKDRKENSSVPSAADQINIEFPQEVYAALEEIPKHNALKFITNVYNDIERRLIELKDDLHTHQISIEFPSEKLKALSS
jgi:alpha-amylase/alpha-mannosidase (GH57 family)